MIKRICSLLVLLSFLCCWPLSAYAYDVPRERDDCSIDVAVRYNGENINGGTLTAVKVGYLDESDGNYFFSRVYDDVRLQDVSSPEAVEALLGFYNTHRNEYHFEMQTVPVTDGIAKFTNLSTGLYLILQETPAEGFSPMSEFLVSVPYMKNGEYQYHVDASIKSELEREPESTEPPPTKPDDPQLPQTGQLNWPIPLMVVSGLLLFIAGWALRFGKKRESHEK